jgi:hypothetical protein
MAQLLQATQASLGSWVGSSVVHLGDHNVPNALTFIDKYCQVPLILNPVISVCLDLPLVAAKDAGMRKYMESAFGSVGGAIDAVLVDFFRQVALLSFSFSFFILPQPLARSLSLIFSTRSKTKQNQKTRQKQPRLRRVRRRQLLRRRLLRRRPAHLGVELG